MTYSSRTRDRYRLAVTAITGLTVAGSLASTGWLMGAAADAYQSVQADKKDVSADRAARVRARYDARVARLQARRNAPTVVLRERPARTRTTTRYVAGATAGAVVGGGGVVASVPSSAGQGGSSSAPTTPTPPPKTNNPPPPPPPPPPAPTNGS